MYLSIILQINRLTVMQIRRTKVMNKIGLGHALVKLEGRETKLYYI